MASYYRDLVALLKEHDCYFARQGRGDHEIWYSPLTDCHFTVDRGCKSRNTANAALKQAGIDKKL